MQRQQSPWNTSSEVLAFHVEIQSATWTGIERSQPSRLRGAAAPRFYLCEGFESRNLYTGIAKAARQMTGLSSAQTKNRLEAQRKRVQVGKEKRRKASPLGQRNEREMAFDARHRKSSQAICSLRRRGSGRRIRTLAPAGRSRAAILFYVRVSNPVIYTLA